MTAQIHLLQSVTSTNDLALEAAPTAEHGECWVAEIQTEGRGRREVGGDRRTWFSPRGVNLYASILLKPQGLEPARAAGLTLAAGIGICEALAHDTALETSGDHGLWLKWPNDIYAGNRKVGGVLTEASTAGNTLEAVVVGIGLNINVPAEDVPDDLSTIMTSVLMETGHVHDRLKLLHHVRNGVVTWCDAYVHKGFPAMQTALERWDGSDGRKVEVVDHERSQTGIARGIDENGHLKVEVDGQIVTLGTGEVRLLV